MREATNVHTRRAKTRAFSDEMESVRAASSVDSPPPCGEGSGVGVVKCGDAAPNRATPLPSPPPQGGREQTECVAPLCINLIGKRFSVKIWSRGSCHFVAAGRRCRGVAHDT